MATDFQEGDLVHTIGNTDVIYEVKKVYPVWYKGRENVMLKPLKHRAGVRAVTAPAYKLIIAEPELLL